ncbi:MAG: hypothetical protein N2169_07955, partial [bacterium]|nr:hypothetical protein [bacterium]
DVYLYTGGNTIKFIDPNGLWTFQIGFSGSAAAGGGVTVGAGFIFGYSNEQGFDIEVYVDAGGGGFIGVLLNATVGFTWSPNKNVHDVSGPALNLGGSCDIGIAGGYQANIPFSNNGPKPKTKTSHTLSIGLGAATGPYILPVEGHAVVSTTEVKTARDALKNLKVQQAIKNVQYAIDNIQKLFSPKKK